MFLKMFLKIQRIPKVLECFIKSSSSSVNKECFNICDGQEFSAIIPLANS